MRNRRSTYSDSRSAEIRVVVPGWGFALKIPGMGSTLTSGSLLTGRILRTMLRRAPTNRGFARGGSEVEVTSRTGTFTAPDRRGVPHFRRGSRGGALWGAGAAGRSCRHEVQMHGRISSVSACRKLVTRTALWHLASFNGRRERSQEWVRDQACAWMWIETGMLVEAD